MRYYRCNGLNLTRLAAGHYSVGRYEIRRELRMWETYDTDGNHLGSDFTLTEACAYVAKLSN